MKLKLRNIQANLILIAHKKLVIRGILEANELAEVFGIGLQKYYRIIRNDNKTKVGK